MLLRNKLMRDKKIMTKNKPKLTNPRTTVNIIRMINEKNKLVLSPK
jgi:hypothetical protein